MIDELDSVKAHSFDGLVSEDELDKLEAGQLTARAPVAFQGVIDNNLNTTFIDPRGLIEVMVRPGREYSQVIDSIIPSAKNFRQEQRSDGSVTAHFLPDTKYRVSAQTFNDNRGVLCSVGEYVQIKRLQKSAQHQRVQSEMDLREQTLWKNVSRMAEQGLGAVESYFGELMKNMKLAAMNRLEATTLLGQNGVGVVESSSGASTTATVVITAASWRPGFWWAMGQGATFDAYTGTTKNNSSGPLILSTITTSTRTLTFTNTGTATSEVTAADVLYFEGSYDGTTYYEQPGLLVQAANTSGTSLGISATTYQNWAGNSKSIGGVLSFDIVEDLCGELRDRGCADALTVMVANKNYGSLAAELRAMRIIDSSYSPAKQKAGQRSIGFETPEIGELEVAIHPFMAWGDVYIQQDQQIARVGSADIGFGVPGLPNNGKEQFLRNIADTNAVELIMYTDQCVANKRPNFSYKATGVTQTGT
jgi:hypothetical protein